MIRILAAFLLIISFASCKLPAYTYKYKDLPPEIQILDTTKGIVLVNGEILPENAIYDMNQSSINPKLEPESISNANSLSTLIAPVAKSNYIDYLTKSFQDELNAKVTVAKDLSREEMQLLISKNPAVADKIMRQYDAGIIIVIQNEEGGFKLNKIEKIQFTNHPNKVSKTALYDVYYETKAMIIQDNIYLDRNIYVSKYHSERNITYDYPNKAPKVRTNKEDIATMKKENAQKLARLFADKKVIETFINNKRYYTDLQ